MIVDFVLLLVELNWQLLALNLFNLGLHGVHSTLVSFCNAGWLLELRDSSVVVAVAFVEDFTAFGVLGGWPGWAIGNLRVQSRYR